MKRLRIFTLLVAVSTSQAQYTENEVQNQWGHVITQGRVTINFAGSNLPPNVTIKLYATDPASNWGTIVTDSNGAISSTNPVQGSNVTALTCQNYNFSGSPNTTWNIANTSATSSRVYNSGGAELTGTGVVCSGGAPVTLTWVRLQSGSDPGCPNPSSATLLRADTVTCSVANPVTGSVPFEGELIIPAHSGAHTLGVKVNGVFVDEVTSVVDASQPQTLTLDGIVDGVNTQGSTIQWVVDGVPQGAATPLTFSNIGSSEIPIWRAGPSVFSGTVGASPVPTPPMVQTPTPTPRPSSTPYASATPGTTPPAYVIPPSPGNAGGTGNGVVVLNPSAIYQPIVDRIGESDSNRKRDTRDALVQAGDDSGTTSVDGTFNTGTAPDTTQTLEVTKTKVTGTITKAENLVTDIKGGLTNKALTMPTVGTSALSFAMTLPVLGALTVNLTPYATWIGVMRNLCLFALYISWWWVTASVIRKGIA